VDIRVTNVLKMKVAFSGCRMEMIENFVQNNKIVEHLEDIQLIKEIRIVKYFQWHVTRVEFGVINQQEKLSTIR
jgi:hypothetical protein